MAGGSALILLIDEIATMVKVTSEKTEKIVKPVPLSSDTDQDVKVYFKHDTGLIWDIAKGSLKNKAILVPAALGLNFFAPWAVLPLVAAGGVYFSRAGIGKLQKMLKGETAAHVPHETDNVPSAQAKARKIKEALRTDMILSAEITAITLALVATMPFAMQAAIMSGVAVGATAAAYTVITGIIKMEDLGGWMASRKSETTLGGMSRTLGKTILNAKPRIMNGISTAGTIAIFMVGGGLIFHGIPAVGYGVSETLSSFIASPYAQSFAKLGVGFMTGLSVGLTFHGIEKGLKTIAKAILPARQKSAAASLQTKARNILNLHHDLQHTITFKIKNIRSRFNTQSVKGKVENPAPNTSAHTPPTPQNDNANHKPNAIKK
jgi:predicted DNA repair protein MutK